MTLVKDVCLDITVRVQTLENMCRDALDQISSARLTGPTGLRGDWYWICPDVMALQVVSAEPGTRDQADGAGPQVKPHQVSHWHVQSHFAKPEHAVIFKAHMLPFTSKAIW